ncbi:unnamed protein product, partial [Hapterophycus canaliculatus]
EFLSGARGEGGDDIGLRSVARRLSPDYFLLSWMWQEGPLHSGATCDTGACVRTKNRLLVTLLPARACYGSPSIIVREHTWWGETGSAFQVVQTADDVGDDGQGVTNGCGLRLGGLPEKEISFSPGEYDKLQLSDVTRLSFS